MGRLAKHCSVTNIYSFVILFNTLNCIPAAVIQLKGLASTLAADEQLSSAGVEKTRTLQSILVYVINIISLFMDFDSSPINATHTVNNNTKEQSSSSACASDTTSPTGTKGTVPDLMLRWQQKAIVLVMEAGGVNWLVGIAFLPLYLFLCFFFENLAVAAKVLPPSVSVCVFCQSLQCYNSVFMCNHKEIPTRWYTAQCIQVPHCASLLWRLESTYNCSISLFMQIWLSKYSASHILQLVLRTGIFLQNCCV